MVGITSKRPPVDRKLGRMTPLGVFRKAPVTTERRVLAALSVALILLAVASILVCLPALHSATDLHRGSDVVDVFDLGANGPEEAQLGFLALLLAAALLSQQRRHGAPGTGGSDRAAAHGARVASCRPRQTRVHLPRLRRCSRSSREADDIAATILTGRMLRTTTPWIPRNLAVPRGLH